MRGALLKTFLWISVVTAAGTLASAQSRYGDRYDNRGYSGGYDRRVQSGDIVRRVADDISRARSYGYLGRSERNHLEKAERELFKFQDRWSRGRFDRDPLDDAISHLNHVVNGSRIDPRERDVLARDLYALRDFRESARRGSYGYR